MFTEGMADFSPTELLELFQRAQAQFTDRVDAVAPEFAEDDALVRTVHLSRGPTPATEYIFEMTADLTVHAWDLARATDGDTELDGELVTAALVYAERLPEDGVPGLIDPPLDVSASADPQTRLLARFGRKA